MYGSVRFSTLGVIQSDLDHHLNLSKFEIDDIVKPYLGSPDFYKDPELQYLLIKKTVETVKLYGWELKTVSYVGGCKASGYPVYHFWNNRDQ